MPAYFLKHYLIFFEISTAKGIEFAESANDPGRKSKFDMIFY